MENRKKNAEQKIVQMKENALSDIKNISIKGKAGESGLHCYNCSKYFKLF